MPEQVRGERCAQLSPGVHRLLRTLLAVHPWEVAELREDEEGGPPLAGVLGVWALVEVKARAGCQRPSSPWRRSEADTTLPTQGPERAEGRGSVSAPTKPRGGLTHSGSPRLRLNSGLPDSNSRNVIPMKPRWTKSQTFTAGNNTFAFPCPYSTDASLPFLFISSPPPHPPQKHLLIRLKNK